MSRRKQLVLAGAVLVATAALSSAKRSVSPNEAGQSRVACCPWVSGLDGLCQRPGTNRPVLNNLTNAGVVANHP